MSTPDTIYRGVKTATGFAVTANGKPLSPAASQKIAFHADGFSWGYSGSGTLQLAIALLFDAIRDVAAARRWVRWYNWLGPVNWGDEWETTGCEIREAIAALDIFEAPPLVVNGGVA